MEAKNGNSAVTALERVDGQHGELRRAIAPLDFTPEQKRIILDQICPGATEMELAALLEVAKAKRLNPLTKQIHFVKRQVQDPVTKQYVERWATQIGIDGFRVQAERTGLYDGQDEAEYEYEPTKDGGKRLLLARVRIYRKDIKRPFVGVARYDEYVQVTRDGSPNKMWRTMPHGQLAKCAEALAFRKGFPEDCGDLYIAEEFDGRDDLPVSPPTPTQMSPGVIEGEVVDEKPAPAAQTAGAPPKDKPAEKSLEDAMKDWEARLTKAATTSECDKVRREAKARLDPEGPDHALVAKWYGEAIKRLRGRAPKEATGGQQQMQTEPPPREEPGREPGSEG